MLARVPPFELYFEPIFLESYARLKPSEQKTVDKAIGYLKNNPRHPSLNVHKSKQVKAKYAIGGDDVFIAYASKGLRFTFEFGPEPGMIAFITRSVNEGYKGIDPCHIGFYQAGQR